ncbi:hypothetical protein OROGR_030994 [Orobanche gracilis]
MILGTVKLFNTYRSFASEEERDGISRSLQETEDWLYDDGDDETLHAYSLVDPIENRYRDEDARAEAMRNLLRCIVEHRMSADSLPPESKELIINQCNKAEKWLREKMQQQDVVPKSSDPVVWSRDIESKAEELKFQYVYRYWDLKILHSQKTRVKASRTVLIIKEEDDVVIHRELKAKIFIS